MTKKTIAVCICAAAMGLLAALAGLGAEPAAPAESAAPAAPAAVSGQAPPAPAASDAPAPAHQIVVYYFMSNPRCMTCRKIEKYTAEAVTSSFASEIASGRLAWRPTDTDKPENAHFIEDFDLFSKAVVVVEQAGGKTMRSKNLEEIWELVYDKDAFQQYITNEVQAFLGTAS